MISHKKLSDTVWGNSPYQTMHISIRSNIFTDEELLMDIWAQNRQHDTCEDLEDLLIGGYKRRLITTTSMVLFLPTIFMMFLLGKKITSETVLENYSCSIFVMIH